MSTLFFISDHHFWHENIIKLCHRPFSSVEEMNEIMIERWNSKVGKKDTVYHLGDLFLLKENLQQKAIEKVESTLQRLNGKIYLIEGNHDSSWLHWFGYDTLNGPVASIINSQSKDYLQLKFNKQKICLFHYPILNWNGIDKGYWHLFGHVHNSKVMNKGLSYNVSVENTDYYPLSFDEIKLIMEEKKNA